VEERIFNGHGGIVTYGPGREVALEDHEIQFMGEVMTVSTYAVSKPRQDFRFRHWLADLIEPTKDPYLTAIVTAVAKGDVECETALEKSQRLGVDATPPPRKLGELNTPYIEHKTARRKRTRRKRGVRIPVLAGEVARLTQQRLGKLTRTSDNVALVEEDVARRVNALQKAKDPRFITMRGNELVSVTRWASEMFWVETTADEDISEYHATRTVASRDTPTDRRVVFSA
jgi:hypothetical protein